MKKLTRNQFIISLIIITILFLSTLLYVFLPYINNWRSQYSYSLELIGDQENPQNALIKYREAEFIYSHESTELKIGKIYDNTNRFDLANRYFSKIRSKKYMGEIADHFFREGDIEKIRSFLIKNTQFRGYIYYKNLLSVLDNPKNSLDLTFDTKDEKSQLLVSILSSANKRDDDLYIKTAVATYLYNVGYTSLALQEIGDYDIDQKEALILLGDIYKSLDNNEKSIQSYKKAISLDKYDINIYKKLLNIYEDTGDYRQAQKIKSQIKELSIINKK